MTDPGNAPARGALPHEGVSARAVTVEQKDPVAPEADVKALLTAVDGEIELLRQSLLKILSEHPSDDSPTQNNQRLEKLVLTLRDANEHLVIASLDASLREAKTAQSHRQQSLFLSMLAHELRNPLAPIAMSVQLLGKMSGLPSAAQSLLRILERQTSHLVRLIDDLMDATRINSGKLKIKKTAAQVSQFIEHAVETSQPQLDAQGQQLHLSLPAEPIWVHGDPVRLSQLFSNLLLNASKFSAERTAIHLSGRLDAQRIIISVKDQGIGISPESAPFIFDLFDQGTLGEGLMAKGLGIGLSLVRTIAQLHGGTVQVISAGVGQGSEFIVSLPILQVAASGQDPDLAGATPATAAGLTRPFASKRVLLIDDNADINQTLGDLLQEAGHQVDLAADGASGLQMADTHHYDVVCSDIGLPGMSGHEVARQLRKKESDLNLIAISGYDQPEQRRQALEAGFDHYLVKPILGEELLALIADTHGHD